MKILLAVDDSQFSLNAVRVLLERPWPEDTLVRVLTAVPLNIPPELGVPGIGMLPTTVSLLESQLAEELEDARIMVSALAQQLEARGLHAEAVARKGDPANVILDEAADWGADLIIMGSHGRTGLRKLFMGSVAQKVVARAHCSVEVAREHPTQTEEQRTPG